jgi:raffinose/stachyose/melibiose transport system permease protein
MSTAPNPARRRANVITSIVMIPIACIVGLPFYYIVVSTLKTQGQMQSDPLGLPSAPTLQNYIDVFQQSPVLQAFFNTLYVTVASVALMLIIGSMAAFAIIIRKTLFNRIVGGALLFAFLIPFQSTLIPLYKLIVGVGLVDTLTGLVAIYSAGAIFCYFIIVGYMRTIPGDIIEAARIDGAGAFRIYRTIVLPLIRPILITVGVFQVMWVWNDYISPTVFLSSPEKSTLVLLASQAVTQFTINWPAFMTVSVLVLIPMVVFFITMQKYIVNGLVSGSVKG